MLNKKQIKTVSFLALFFMFVLRSNGGINPLTPNDPAYNDSILLSLTGKSSLSIPQVPLHQSMEKFVQEYAEDNMELFEKIKLNKTGYLKTIDRVFAQHQIPLELKYLAVIESKLNTNALSWCGAKGLWQFMPGTAKIFGLKITAKYDERQHVWKSSVAAARYLNELYEYFGDWLLVIAAYNSGPAPVLNAIKKSGSRSFWKLQYFLPRETRLHVKRFIATHYYFEGGGSLVTLGKVETEKYLKNLEEFNAKNNSDEEQQDTNPIAAFSQWIGVDNHEKNLQLILKK
ncbi:MAG TPA: lytic transglycosylase domain-containing protein [Chitinophagaceae bacterium]|nr:lytic transglycosylase domain-containing protein [Chitinophagaceae bacterium]